MTVTRLPRAAWVILQRHRASGAKYSHFHTLPPEAGEMDAWAANDRYSRLFPGHDFTVTRRME